MKHCLMIRKSNSMITSKGSLVSPEAAPVAQELVEDLPTIIVTRIGDLTAPFSLMTKKATKSTMTFIEGKAETNGLCLEVTTDSQLKKKHLTNGNSKRRTTNFGTNQLLVNHNRKQTKSNSRSKSLMNSMSFSTSRGKQLRKESTEMTRGELI